MPEFVDGMPMEWMPMETAPKDGTKFLAWWPTVTLGSIQFTYWDDQKYHVKPLPRFIYDGHWGASDSRSNQPTHWMPLPAPPEEA